MDRPNVLWIFCDELRTDALECYGNPRASMATPRTDALAGSGVVFDEFFVNSPVCVPSRTSMLTGLPPERTGVYHNEAHWPGYPPVGPLVTFPQMFAEHGYRTMDFGKQHVPRSMHPWQSQTPDGARMSDPLGTVPEERLGVLRTRHMRSVMAGAYPAGEPFPPERVTDNVVAALRDTPEPFVIRASYLQPHTPVVPPEPYASRYHNVEFPDTAVRNPQLSRFEQRFGEIYGGFDLLPEEFRRAQASYYGLVSWVDEQIGQLLRALDERGLAENTIVVLTADHGCYLGEQGGYGKHTFAPMCHRVPFIVRWSGTLPRGQRRGDLAQGLDLGRTLLGMCGLPAPDQFHGRDLFDEPAPEAVFATIGYGAPASRAFPNSGTGTYLDGRGWPRRSCVRTSRYRLDMNTRIDGQPPASEEERDVFLADRLADPHETHNHAADPVHRDTVAGLTRRLLGHTAGGVETPDDIVYRDRLPAVKSTVPLPAR